MSQIVYINGRYVPFSEARLGIEDRGTQFGDAVYEVVSVIDGVLCDEEAHLDRLERSLAMLDMALTPSKAALALITRRIIARNALCHGIVYFQISRGCCPREHSYAHLQDRAPNIYVYAKPIPLASLRKSYGGGLKVTIKPDIRWQHCDIKSVGLLANCMAKSAAQHEGFDDAWMVDAEGMITEGTSANAWIVDDTGVLRTRHLSEHILRGITRTSILDNLPETTIAERAFTLEELYSAREVFQSSASGIKPVARINDVTYNVGEVTRAIQTAVLGEYRPDLPKILQIV